MVTLRHGIKDQNYEKSELIFLLKRKEVGENVGKFRSRKNNCPRKALGLSG